MAFYKELNKLSTADFYVQNDKKRKVTTSSKDFFEIERVISRRIRQGNVSINEVILITYL